MYYVSECPYKDRNVCKLPQLKFATNWTFLCQYTEMSNADLVVQLETIKLWLSFSRSLICQECCLTELEIKHRHI